MHISELLERAGVRRVPTPVIALVLAGAVVAAVASWWPARPVAVASGGPATAAVVTGSDSANVEPAAETSIPPEPPMVTVHVVGAVLRPGVYLVAEEGRVADAVESAGGMTGDANEAGINLARYVADGEQIRVPTQDETRPAADSGPAAPAGSTSGPVGPVDINAADTTALEALPGIGPATAARIVADREANGPFAAVDDLMRVSGIGERKLEGLRDQVTVR